MAADEQSANGLSTPTPTPNHAHEPYEYSLTDVIDQFRRRAFTLALERRHANPSYRTVIEAAHLVRTTSS